MMHVSSGLKIAVFLSLFIAPSAAFATDREPASEPIGIAVASADFSGAEEKAFLCSHLTSTAEAPDLSDEERVRVKEELRRLCR